MKESLYSSYEQAFDYMVQMTKNNNPFKVSFVKENGEVKIIPKALLRKSTPSSADKNAQFKFNLIDTVNSNYATAYIPLLLSVNDKRIVLQ